MVTNWLFRAAAVLRRRHSEGFLEHTGERHLIAETTVGHDSLEGVVGIAAHQFRSVCHALLVQIVGKVLTTTLLSYNTTERCAVDTHHTAEIVARNTMLSVKLPAFNLFVEILETGGIIISCVISDRWNGSNWCCVYALIEFIVGPIGKEEGYADLMDIMEQQQMEGRKGRDQRQ